jgi:hypothetical protein
LAAAPQLSALVADEIAQPVDPRVTAIAAAIVARYPEAARAILFNGSCLWTADLDRQMLDFCLIVSSYRAAYGESWLGSANRLVPPNVFPFEKDGLAARYAVLSEADFRRLNGPAARSVSVRVRFAQPSRLVWQADEKAMETCVAAIARAAPSLLAAARPLLAPAAEADPLNLWRLAFGLAYSAELRAERGSPPASVVDADPERYRLFSPAAIEAARLGRVEEGGRCLLDPVSEAQRDAAARAWAQRRRSGKLLSAVRLAKASGTFAGGVDHLAWKINRRAGTQIRIAPWQRRWPLIGTVSLLLRLLTGKAVR